MAPRTLRHPPPPASDGEVSRTQLIRALALLLTVIFGGVVSFMLVEGWSFWRAFYFTLITITTVGYGDEGISPDGQKVATLLLIGGIGVASYTFALVVQSAVSNQFAWRRLMQKNIDRMKGHTIVCGYGRMGQTLCERLREEDMPVLVIEEQRRPYEEAVEAGFAALLGCASEDEVLERAGIERAGSLACVVDSPAVNVVVTLTARSMRPDIVVVARAEGPREVKKLERAGATGTVSPFRNGGLAIADLIVRPGVADFLARSQRGGSDVALAEVSVGEGSYLTGRTLADYGSKEGRRVAFVALERPGHPVLIPPPGSEEFTAGDVLIVAGDPDQVAAMRSRAKEGVRAA